MAATSYSTLPSTTHIAHRSKGDSRHPNKYGTYDSGIGSLTSHPYQDQTDGYATDNQQQSLYSNSGYATQQAQNHPVHKHPKQSTNNSQRSKSKDRSQTVNIKNKNTGSYATTKTTQPAHKKNTDHQQNSHTGTIQHRPSTPTDHQHHHSTLIRSEHQISNPHKHQTHSSQPPPQSNSNHSNYQTAETRVPSPPETSHFTTRDSEAGPKTNHPVVDLKPTRSSKMRAAAIKRKEEKRQQKRQDEFFPSSENKRSKSKLQQENAQTDGEQSDHEKTKRNDKQTRSLSKTPKTPHSDDERTDTEKSNRKKSKSHTPISQRKSRRDGHHADDNHSLGDENHKRQRSKSKKRTTFSDSHLDKQPHLPPLRRGRKPPYHEPYLDYPLPPGHPLRGRFQYDGYPPYEPYSGPYTHRHLYEDADDIPPYLPPYHDPYDPFFDYQKRKSKPKHSRDKNDPHTDHEDNDGRTNGHETERDDGARSQASRKSRHKSTNPAPSGRKSRRDYDEHLRTHWPSEYYPPNYYPRGDMLEMWRQERNDYLKKKFKPTIHDVLYSQQWMKADSYLENQRRRTLRHAQGYYFPYKQYTLKDYKDMQKLNNQNPYADVQEITIDRKELAKKRQEYGALVERQMADNPGARHVPPREMPPRQPWHLSDSAPQDPNNASKRERALEYAKVQIKYRPIDPSRNRSQNTSDPSEKYGNNIYLGSPDDDDQPNHHHTNQFHQSYDDYN